MAEVKKFLFDRSFDVKQAKKEPDIKEGPEEQESEAAVEAEPAVEIPTFSEEDLEMAREVAYKKGIEEGLREASAATERRAADALDIIGAKMSDLMHGRAADRDEAVRSAVSVAAVMMHKTFPEFNRRNGLREVEVTVEEAILRVLEEPRILIRVDSEARTILEGRIEDVAAARGYEGKITVLEDTNLSVGDCRIEWGDGGAERDAQALWREIDEIIERNLETSIDDNELGGGQDRTKIPSPPQSQASETPPELDPEAGPASDMHAEDLPSGEPDGSALKEPAPVEGSGEADVVHMTEEVESLERSDQDQGFEGEMGGVSVDGMTDEPD